MKTEENKEEGKKPEPVEEGKKKLSQVSFRVDPETTGKEMLEVFEYRKKKGLSKDLGDMFHQMFNFIKKEKNTFSSFKTGK